MKMGCIFFSGFFWGTLLIVLGAIIILKVLFNIDIPIFRILFAVLLIYFGIRILAGGFCCGTPKKTAVFSEPGIVNVKPSGNEYKVVFGKGVIDLSDLSLEKGAVQKKVDTVFGSCTIKINPELPVLVRVKSAFAGARMPDGNVATFGEYIYRSKNYKDGAPALTIDANVAFGELNIVLATKQ
jgi:predicted membrane protein